MLRADTTHQSGLDVTMTYLAELLGTTLLGVASAFTPAQLGQMNRSLGQQQSKRGRK